jgi:hypothetical protein
MKHLYIIVEGETELEFIRRLLIPYFSNKGITIHMQAIAISIKGGGHGYNNIEHFKNTIEPLLSYKNEPIITTMIDYYGINSEKKMPNYNKCMQKNGTDVRIACMEQELNNQVQSVKPYQYFIPHIQKHELETLLFVNPQNGFDLEDEKIKNDVIALANKHDNIEEINSTPEGAPSKRLTAIYQKHGSKYSKGADAIDIVELIGFANVLNRCSHFKSWIDKLENALLAL